MLKATRLIVSGTISVAVVVAGFVVGNSGNWLAGTLVLAPGVTILQPFGPILLQFSRPTRQVIVGTVSAGTYAFILYLLFGLIWAGVRRLNR